MTEQNGSIDPRFLGELLKDAKEPSQFKSMFRTLKQALIERALGGELSMHPVYAHGDAKPGGQSNHRNGARAKTVLTDEGTLAIEVSGLE